MLQSLKNLLDARLYAGADEIGTISDFYFHPDRWIVRYLAASVEISTGSVVLSPLNIGGIDRDQRIITVDLDADLIRNSPRIEDGRMVSRTEEAQVHDYFQWPYYWEDEKVVPTTGPGDLTGVPLAEMEADLELQQDEMAEDSAGETENLRSFHEVLGFSLNTRDQNGKAGQLDDFLVHDQNWRIFYALVDIGGKKVIVSPSLMTYIDWDDREIIIDLTSETIAESPAYDPSLLDSDEFDEDTYS